MTIALVVLTFGRIVALEIVFKIVGLLETVALCVALAEIPNVGAFVDIFLLIIAVTFPVFMEVVLVTLVGWVDIPGRLDTGKIIL